MEVLLLRMKKVQIDPLLHFPLNQNMFSMSSHTHVCEMPLTYTELSGGSFSASPPAMAPIILSAPAAALAEEEQCSDEGQGCSALHLGFPQSARKVKIKEETELLSLFLP